MCVCACVCVCVCVCVVHGQPDAASLPAQLNKENEELDARVAEYTTRAKRCNDSMTTKVQAVQKVGSAAAGPAPWLRARADTNTALQAGTTAATWVETQHPVG